MDGADDPTKARADGFGARRSRLRSAGVLGCLIVAALVWMGVRVITEGQNTKDGAQYERLAVELARSGRFASGGVLTREVEPLHVGALALQVRLDPRLADVRASGRVAGSAQSRALKQQNLLWGGLLLAGVAMQGLLLRDRNRVLVAGVAVAGVTLFLLENPDVVDRSLAELPAAALVTWVGVFAMRMVQSPTWGRALTMGAALGALTLTRAVFFYVALPYALVFAGMLWWRYRPSAGSMLAARRVGGWVLIGLIGFGTVVGPWAVRNTVVFGDPGIAERGGQILHIRAIKNTMDGDQHRGAWVYWAPRPAHELLSVLLRVDRDDFGPGGPLSPLARSDEEVVARGETFLQIAQQNIRDRADELVLSGFDATAAHRVAEAEFGALALSSLRKDPGAFLRTTPVFLWRFSWPMSYSSTVPLALLAVINLAGMALLLSAAVWAVVRGHAVMFSVVGLPAGAAMFYVLVTHALPRYARPLAPTMILLIVMTVASGWDRLGQRSGQGTNSSP